MSEKTFGHYDPWRSVHLVALILSTLCCLEMLGTDYPVTPHHSPEKWKPHACFFYHWEARRTQKHLPQAPPRCMFFVLNLGKIQVSHVLYTFDRQVMHLFRELKIAGKWRTTTEGSNLLQFRFVTWPLIEENSLNKLQWVTLQCATINGKFTEYCFSDVWMVWYLMNSDADGCSLQSVGHFAFRVLVQYFHSTSDVLTSSKMWGLTGTRKGSPSLEAVVVQRMGSCPSIRHVNRTQISAVVINSYSLQYTSIVITVLLYVVFPEHGCKVSPSPSIFLSFSILWPELCVMLFWLNLRVPQQSACFF